MQRDIQSQKRLEDLVRGLGNNYSARTPLRFDTRRRHFRFFFLF